MSLRNENVVLTAPTGPCPPKPTDPTLDFLPGSSVDNPWYAVTGGWRCDAIRWFDGEMPITPAKAGELQIATKSIGPDGVRGRTD